MGNHIVEPPSRSDGSGNYGSVPKKYRVLESFPDAKQEPQGRWARHLGRIMGKIRHQTIHDDMFLPRLPKGYALAFDYVTSSRYTESRRYSFYIYGHPSGRTYRSFKQFRLHLLWLETNEKLDHTQCLCELCFSMSHPWISKSVRSVNMSPIGPNEMMQIPIPITPPPIVQPQLSVETVAQLRLL
ncbi:uncharacterized protein BYT42DRAFT_584589 [Radiomyces spectabilis]|uniref:uncharacterized protein n=1 Tax=Radiomyces spectabilis TaxID=64574 RepID=UPI0022210426|nr:uncharacterized protein BYT42DRAFT_584589 [Radiomyces spectabilis]KAI8369475.1 hypothetical protein BYT42DRAFT_584589 [Radiomyces spectabilis]